MRPNRTDGLLAIAAEEGWGRTRLLGEQRAFRRCGDEYWTRKVLTVRSKPVEDGAVHASQGL